MPLEQNVLEIQAKQILFEFRFETGLFEAGFFAGCVSFVRSRTYVEKNAEIKLKNCRRRNPAARCRNVPHNIPTIFILTAINLSPNETRRFKKTAKRIKHWIL
jgi:hypothetical protein